MAGLRDEGLLESALARAQNYGSRDRVEMAAAYTAGIVRNDLFLTGTSEPGLSPEFCSSSSTATASSPVKKMPPKPS